MKWTAQTICTGYKENIVVLESGYFFDYLCHWNWFLLSLLIFNLFLYTFLILGGSVSLAGNSVRAEKWHWQVQKVTLAGPKNHTRAKMSHWSVTIKGLRPVLDGFVVTMHEGACETGSQIPRALARGIWRTVRTSPSALWQQTPTDRS